MNLQGAWKSWAHITWLPLEGTTGSLCQDQPWSCGSHWLPRDNLCTTHLNSDPRAYSSQQQQQMVCQPEVGQWCECFWDGFGWASSFPESHLLILQKEKKKSTAPSNPINTKIPWCCSWGAPLLAICLSDKYYMSTHVYWGHKSKQDRNGSCPYRTYLLMRETDRMCSDCSQWYEEND